MKVRNLLFISISAFFIQSCSNDDMVNEPEDPITEEPTTEEPEETENSAPEAFDLLTVENEDSNIELAPTLTWNAAIDADGDSITYKILLDTNTTPETVLGENIEDTSFVLTTNLERNTTYYWMVVAIDANGAETNSTSIFSFSTKGISLAEVALQENAAFSARRNHTITEFNGKLYLIGGQDDSNGYKDVWSSVDGKDWTLVAEEPFGFFPKSNHTAIVFKDKLWVIGGGFSDVWSTSDGETWTRNETSPGFDSREGHSTVVYNDKLWVIGGTSVSDQKNDVWSSEDGLVWEQVAESTQFSPRADHTTVVFEDKMYVIGGMFIEDFSSNFLNDIYSSTDGINWVEVDPATVFGVRAEHTSVVYDNKIWVIGGWQAVVNETTFEQDVTTFADAWYSENGIDWVQIAINETFAARLGHATTLFENKIIVSGGLDLNASANSRTHSNDVWVIE
ncbi:Galactose oxidase, central domain [Maribacter dokdonensis]|uniref:Galactose oxidase, central domain n=1 Tax=Maribacter dokdonensis TaxID=320912 RepID=A0A1H4RYL1_9FLAO|nr:kelch repeat-containing protein [Maribacter dokdonensis]SEC36887.1 Galactose oxidase, central domain [Maribacter dokdonensis]